MGFTHQIICSECQEKGWRVTSRNWWVLMIHYKGGVCIHLAVTIHHRFLKTLEMSGLCSVFDSLSFGVKTLQMLQQILLASATHGQSHPFSNSPLSSPRVQWTFSVPADCTPPLWEASAPLCFLDERFFPAPWKVPQPTGGKSGRVMVLASHRISQPK